MVGGVAISKRVAAAEWVKRESIEDYQLFLTLPP
jgi:hypothetical protein